MNFSHAFPCFCLSAFIPTFLPHVAIFRGWMDEIRLAHDAQRAADVAARKKRGDPSRLADAAKRLRR